ncbi:hypothetical protein H8356DRAFT_1344448 [Neocallimastix lanati (nom. inval.)]|nr:hypothetical protein H8356DRAFT_1344448 [Neocallimastix sp. JGI-2020a]
MGHFVDADFVPGDLDMRENLHLAILRLVGIPKLIEVLQAYVNVVEVNAESEDMEIWYGGMEPISTDTHGYCIDTPIQLDDGMGILKSRKREQGILINATAREQQTIFINRLNYIKYNNLYQELYERRSVTIRTLESFVCQGNNHYQSIFLEYDEINLKEPFFQQKGGGNQMTRNDFVPYTGYITGSRSFIRSEKDLDKSSQVKSNLLQPEQVKEFDEVEVRSQIDLTKVGGVEPLTFLERNFTDVMASQRCYNLGVKGYGDMGIWEGKTNYQPLSDGIRSGFEKLLMISWISALIISSTPLPNFPRSLNCITFR